MEVFHAASPHSAMMRLFKMFGRVTTGDVERLRVGLFEPQGARSLEAWISHVETAFRRLEMIRPGCVVVSDLLMKLCDLVQPVFMPAAQRLYGDWQSAREYVRACS